MSVACLIRVALNKSSGISLRAVSLASCRLMSSDPMPLPNEDLNQAKKYTPKITQIVDQIENLTLLEVADLNELLKKRLNISDAPVMMGAVAAPAAATPTAEEAEEESAPAAVQTSFTLKLESFEADKKVALIKEIKANVEGYNLVQAKKFVESAPAVVKEDLSKDEAEKLKKALEGAGAKCSID